MRNLHHVGPDARRHFAAGDARHRLVVVIADPDAADIPRRVAKEPGVAPFLAGAGLARDVPAAEPRCAAGAGDDNARQHRVHVADQIFGVDAWRGHCRPLVEQVATRVTDFLDDVGRHLQAALGQHAEAGRHLHERDFVRAQRDRRVVVQL